MLNAAAALRLRGAGLPARRRGLGVALGALLVLSAMTNDASAAALGSLATSVGLIAALTAMVMFKGWSTQGGAAGPLSTVGAVALLGAGALVLWRVIRGASGSTAQGAGVWALFRRGGARADASAASPRPTLELPAGLDGRVLARTLCDHFLRLQEAWDSNDAAALAALTTPTMLEELHAQLCGYAGCSGRTDVLSLDASLLGYEQRDSVELVCVEFSGMLRDSAHSGATPFRELWMLERSKQPSAAWKLARQQTLL